MIPSLLFFLPESEYIEVGLRSEELQEAHEVGGAPPPSWTGGGPPGLHLLRGFFIISKNNFHGFQVIPRTFVSAYK